MTTNPETQNQELVELITVELHKHFGEEEGNSVEDYAIPARLTAKVATDYYQGKIEELTHWRDTYKNLADGFEERMHLIEHSRNERAEKAESRVAQLEEELELHHQFCHVEALEQSRETMDKWLKSIYPGWHRLIYDTDYLLRKLDPEYEITQVKEKFGGLRYYTTHQHLIDEGQQCLLCSIIDNAEAISFHICEECGEPGELRKYGLLAYTSCEVHRKDRESDTGAHALDGEESVEDKPESRIKPDSPCPDCGGDGLCRHDHYPTSELCKGCQTCKGTGKVEQDSDNSTLEVEPCPNCTEPLEDGVWCRNELCENGIRNEGWR